MKLTTKEEMLLKELAGYERAATDKVKAADKLKKMLVARNYGMKVTFTYKGTSWSLCGVDSFEYNEKKKTTWFYFVDNEYLAGCEYVKGKIHVTDCYQSVLDETYNSRDVEDMLVAHGMTGKRG